MCKVLKHNVGVTLAVTPKTIVGVTLAVTPKTIDNIWDEPTTGAFAKNMKYNPEKHHRRSIRLKDYDYSQPGSYFVTICTYNREYLFGEIVNGEMKRSVIGEIVQEEWCNIPNRFPNIQLDSFIVMPNHIHGILNVGATLVVAQKNRRGNPCGYPKQWAGVMMRAGASPAPTGIGRKRAGASPAPTLGDVIGSFKSLCEYKCRNRGLTANKFWQRNYYEHIIRNETELNKIREYIINNPLQWELDIENLSRTREYKNIVNYFNGKIRWERLPKSI